MIQKATYEEWCWPSASLADPEIPMEYLKEDVKVMIENRKRQDYQSYLDGAFNE